MGEVRTIHFTANVIPRGKQRARTVNNGWGVHSYTPRETVIYERKIAWACRSACRDAQMPENAPLSLEAVFYMPIPKSANKGLRERMASERMMHTKKPDTDNMLKSVLDGCNGIAYKDDNQIAQIRATKVYSENPRVEVTISTIGG